MILAEQCRALLVAADDDWVSLAEAAQLVKDSLPSAEPAHVRDATLYVLEDMLRRGLMLIGQLSPGFTAWEMTTAEAVDALRRKEWPTPETELSPFEGCWFAITTQGEKLLAESG